ncbi:MAG: 2-oxo acid dehydrogenase subunit E2 [Rhodospirillales bacterium]|nr:2-oxo acid dehydrogenase subunit E2 [Rhodospirillales bacterium]
MSNLIAPPSVRALARKKGIDVEELARDTGRSSIAREDIKVARPAEDSASYWDVDHTAFGPVREEAMTRIAQVSAANLSAANRLIPQVTHHDRADATMLEAIRVQLKSDAQARGIKLTALAFQVKALGRALRKFPRFNASLSADGKRLFFKEYIHIGIAVDTPYGLMVPVLRDVDRKGIWEIAAELAALAGRAKERKVRPQEMGGASMSITSLGGIGGIGFTPIVNPPEVAILGISRNETVTVWEGNTPRPVAMVPLDLSYDHRVIDGADAARFLAYLCGLIANPRRILL